MGFESRRIKLYKTTMRDSADFVRNSILTYGSWKGFVGPLSITGEEMRSYYDGRSYDILPSVTGIASIREDVNYGLFMQGWNSYGGFLRSADWIEACIYDSRLLAMATRQPITYITEVTIRTAGNRTLMDNIIDGLKKGDV